MSNTEDQIQRCIDKMVAEALEGFFTKGVVEHEVYKERDKLLEENKRLRAALGTALKLSSSYDPIGENWDGECAECGCNPDTDERVWEDGNLCWHCKADKLDEVENVAQEALATAAKEGEVEELVCSKCDFSTTIKHYSCPCCIKTNTHDAGEG